MKKKSRDIIPDVFEDDDTYRLLDITLEFLRQYFGHSEDDAEALMTCFFNDFSKRFDEDGIHHESSYRMAAIIHYLSHQKGNPDALGDWLVSSGNNQAPSEALEYFREHYFA
jgi:hypothetical protein